MADSPNQRFTYMQSRKKYNRPSGMLWSENSGTIINSLHIPYGLEVGANPTDADPNLLDQFLILTDDNRSPLDFSDERIEKRERMINGRMRSYHIADKMRLSTSWSMIPSRSHSDLPNFDTTTGKSLAKSYTTDGGAGGADILEWYDAHKGSFWVFLAYDRKGIYKGQEDPYDHLQQYNQIIEMFISSFTYSVEKRGPNFDYWNVSVTLDEV
jgi:hypothetical protein